MFGFHAFQFDGDFLSCSNVWTWREKQMIESLLLVYKKQKNVSAIGAVFLDTHRDKYLQRIRSLSSSQGGTCSPPSAPWLLSFATRWRVRQKYRWSIEWKDSVKSRRLGVAEGKQNCKREHGENERSQYSDVAQPELSHWKWKGNCGSHVAKLSKGGKGVQKGVTSETPMLLTSDNNVGQQSIYKLHGEKVRAKKNRACSCVTWFIQGWGGGGVCVWGV